MLIRRDRYIAVTISKCGYSEFFFATLHLSFRKKNMTYTARIITTLSLLALVFPVTAHAQLSEEPLRKGFTLVVKAGTGFQQDGRINDAAFGLQGVDLGLGEFLNKDLAVMLRISTVDVTYDNLFGFNQVSGFAGATLQYWMNDRVYIEGGPGIGFSRIKNRGDNTAIGISALAGAGMSVHAWGKHNILVGIEYSPAFYTTKSTIHSAGLKVGYQLF